ncbi:MAG: hypothetical protein J7M03_00565 [Candidatus Desulfofervidaceae bacterium]|nr:hypothetical protein [Candidatus Desulfofervidaceae bacterium]MDL1970573.1 hypothetical protein [Candidatus Desulfofervidaceae bacterium]
MKTCFKGCVLFSLFLLLLPIQVRAEETIITTGRAPATDNLVDARQQAVDQALNLALVKAVQTIYPYPDEITKEISPYGPDYIQNYRILHEERVDNNYCVQLEAQIDWERLSRKLDRRGIICPGNGEKILLVFNLPEGIDFKAQLLSFWKRFFHLFRLTPVYKESLNVRNASDYAFKQGIPFILSLNIAAVSGIEENSFWSVTFKTELTDVTYQDIVFQDVLEKKIPAADIETFIQMALAQTQILAYNIAPRLSNWLEKEKKRVYHFALIFTGISRYQQIFDIWQMLEKINGISQVCLKQASDKEIIYTGNYQGLIPDLVNQLGSLGFAVDKVKGNTIFLHKD